LLSGPFRSWTVHRRVDFQGNHESTCTESTFRKHYWERTTTDADEPTRFAEVLTMMEHDATLPKAPTAKNRLARQLRDRFGDGTWHGLRAIVEALEADLAPVQRALDGMRRQGTQKTLGVRCPLHSTH
jgi:hypothetical protein